MWFHLGAAASKDTDVWREGKHLPLSAEHSCDTTRGRMEHSISHRVQTNNYIKKRNKNWSVMGPGYKTRGQGGGGGSPGVPASASSAGTGWGS